jgi:hypothetical protein
MNVEWTAANALTYERVGASLLKALAAGCLPSSNYHLAKPADLHLAPTPLAVSSHPPIVPRSRVTLQEVANPLGES